MVSKKKVSKRKKVSKKQTNSKKWVALGIATFFIFAFALNFVNITNSSNVTEQITGYGIIGDLMSDWTQGTISTTIAKYLFFFLGIILLYSLTSVVFSNMNGFLKFMISIILSFLFVGFIVPNEMLSILPAYSALGLTFITIIPFIVLFFFTTIILSSKKLSPIQVVLERFVWLLFSVFLLYKLITLYISGGGDKGIIIFLAITTFVSFLIFAWHKLYLALITSTLVSAYKAMSERKAALRQEKMLEQHKQKLVEKQTDFFGYDDQSFDTP